MNQMLSSIEPFHEQYERVHQFDIAGDSDKIHEEWYV